MIKHIVMSDLPARTACGKVRKHESRFPVPLGCQTCMEVVTAIAAGDRKWESVKTQIDYEDDPYEGYRKYYKGLMTKAASAFRNALRFGGR